MEWIPLAKPLEVEKIDNPTVGRFEVYAIGHDGGDFKFLIVDEQNRPVLVGLNEYRVVRRTTTVGGFGSERGDQPRTVLR